MTSITRFNILATVLTWLLLACSVSYFFIYLPHSNYEKQTKQLQHDYLTEYKKSVQNEISRTIKRLEYLYDDFEKDSDLHLAMHARTLEHISVNIHKTPHLSPLQQATTAQQAIENAGFDDEEIVFIFNARGEVIYDSESYRLNKLNRAARIGAPLLKQLLSQQTTKSSSDTAIICLPTAATESHELETFRVLDRTSPTNKWRIIVAFATKEIEKKIQHRFLNRLAKVRFGTDNSGYFFVLDHKAQALMISAHSTEVDAAIPPLPLSNKAKTLSKQLTEIAQTGGSFHKYQFINPAHNNEIQEKISFVASSPYWGWTIGTGFYISTLNSSIEKGQKQLLEETQQRIRIGYIVIVINLIAGLAIATYINRHVKKLEVKRTAHLRNLEQYKALIDKMCLVSKSDLQGIITYANQSFCEVSGYTKEELLGHPHSLVRHPSVPKSFFADMWKLLQEGETWRGINKNLTKDGKSFYVNTVISPLTKDDGEVEEFIAAHYDITELLEKRDEIKSIFATDSLTTLSTRHQLIEDLTNNSQENCLALFDIDDFHGINNQLGIEGADNVLRHVSEQMINFFSNKSCRLYRLHSDIFAVLGKCNDGNLVKYCHQFLSKTSHHPVVTATGEQFNLTLVIGVACGEDDIINCADNALLSAKKHNKALEVYTPNLDGSREKGRTYWINQVQKAIKEKRLVPYFQPIVNLHTGEIEKYEALMRLIDEHGQAVPPGTFLPILEQTRYYPEMTRSIVEQSCQFFSNRTEHFSVNLSLDDLLRSRTVEFIITAAQKYGVTNRIVLEIVETENVQNYDLALDVLQLLGEQGMTIAIDDFGSGYANFSYLSEFPAKFVKIDGSLISKINHDKKTKMLVKTLIDYAQQSGMQVIAEFVSDEKIKETITELGCDFGQGYHFSPPLPAADIAGNNTPTETS